MRLRLRLGVLALLVAVGCSPGPGVSQRPSTPPTVSSPSDVAPVSPAPSRVAPTVDVASAYATVEALAGRIGPREATTPAYRQAVDLVARRLSGLGYDVTTQRVRVPAGVSWGVRVPAGETTNVVAVPAGASLTRPHVLIGAHLDTVPRAPGAEDNASGIAVLLELARLAAAHPPRVPAVFVAFGAEEPRGSGDERHHYGSRYFVAQLSEDERAALRGMLSLDRVGVGSRVPVCNGGRSPRTLVVALRAAAARARVPVRDCGRNRSSDHWSFEKAGVVAARLGSTPYPEYHSAADRPGVVQPAQLGRSTRVVWQWLSQLS